MRKIAAPQPESDPAGAEAGVRSDDGAGASVLGVDEAYSGTGEDRVDRGEAKGVAAAASRDVLVVHPVAWTTRLIRETLENFTEARVDTTADPLRGFELALRRPYRLFVFAMQNGELPGPMLYELISVACAAGRAPARLAPGVVLVREREDPRLSDELARDARVKDVLTKPLRIERLLQSVEGSLEVRDPTSGG